MCLIMQAMIAVWRSATVATYDEDDVSWLVFELDAQHGDEKCGASMHTTL